MSGLVVHVTVDDGRRKFQENFGLLVFLDTYDYEIKKMSAVSPF